MNYNEKFNLTPRQKDCYEFIKQFIDENGYAPSYDEIGDALELVSKSNVHRLVNGLEERNWIRRIPNSNRSITLL